MIDRLLAAGPPAAAGDLLASTIDRMADLRRYNIDTADFDPLVDHLLAHDLDVAPAFMRALEGNFPALARRLSERLDLARKDALGLYPLHRAVVHGAVDIVRDLLARGADPLARDDHGKTPHDRA